MGSHLRDTRECERIEQLYKALEIPERDWPEYKDSTSFAQQIKRTSITKDVASSYSNGTTATNPMFVNRT